MLSSLFDLLNDGIHKALHDLQFVLLIVADDCVDDVLHGFDEVFKGHLVLVEPFSHNPDENEVIIVLCDLLIGHACKIGQFGELARCEYPLRSDAALAVKYFQHVLDHVHLFDLL